jgi:hypothetical protein
MLEYSNEKMRREQLDRTRANPAACGGFTSEEVRFLLGTHPVERAVHDGREVLSGGADLRALGCPERLFLRVLEGRARKIGNKFAEFRAAQRPATADDLDSRIAGSKLF